MATAGMSDTPRSGNDSGGGQLGNAIKCKPGGPNDYLYVVVQEVVWDALARRVGGDALAADPRFSTIQLRRKNQKEMWRLLTEFASGYTKRELMQVLSEIDVPCGPILSTEDLMNDEHAKLREMVVELDHPQRGKWLNIGMPIKLSDSPAEIKRSPLLGEHTDEILREVLGYSDAELGTLKEAGAFSKEPPKVKEYHALREAG
jgi:formyl-CoA transferase